MYTLTLFSMKTAFQVFTNYKKKKKKKKVQSGLQIVYQLSAKAKSTTVQQVKASFWGSHG